MEKIEKNEISNPEEILLLDSVESIEYNSFKTIYVFKMSYNIL